MAARKANSMGLAEQRLAALSRWDSEGGAGPAGPEESVRSAKIASDSPQLTGAELVHLRVRVIALENIVIALLANASGAQLDTAREMASYISPRPGFSHHPLTTQASALMRDLVERADRFRP